MVASESRSSTLIVAGVKKTVGGIYNNSTTEDRVKKVRVTSDNIEKWNITSPKSALKVLKFWNFVLKLNAEGETLFINW